MKTYVPIGWLRGSIYFGIGGALVAGGLFYLVRPGMAPAGRALGAAIIVSTVYIVWRLMKARIDYGKLIAWYAHVAADSQMAVLPGGAREWLSSRRGELEGQVTQAWRWWAIRHPDHADAIEESLDGVEIAVLAQDEPLRDPRLTERARALTDPGKIRIWFPVTQAGVAAYLKGYGSESTTEVVFWAALRHEVAHLCLYAMGVPGELHHERMNAEGCPDK